MPYDYAEEYQKQGSDTIYKFTDRNAQDQLEAIQIDTNPRANVYGFIENMAEMDCSKRITYIDANKNYSPMTIDLSGTHGATYNEWSNFPIITENKPCMVKYNGIKDYELDPTDYSKKLDGTSSDVANTSYNGGAYSWLPKIYKKTVIQGNYRTVEFSFEPRPGFIAQGFIDEEEREMPGLWLPMFYGTEITQNGKVKLMSLATGSPSQNKNTATQKQYIDNLSKKARFYGGPIIDTIADLLTMFGKNNDVQAIFGTGNSGRSYAAENMIANSVNNPGQFYGTTDGQSINRAFHSMLLLTQNQWQRDPYTLNIDGKFYVSTDYHYDITGATYLDTGITVTPPSSNSWVYPHQYEQVDGFGAIPKAPYSGSQTTGGSDGLYLRADQLTSGVRVGIRFAACNNGRYGGPRCLYLADAAGNTYWSVGASALLFPPSEPVSEEEILLPDDSLDLMYKLGVNNGLMYIEEL